ncbi:MAG: hypothetical protein N2450_05100, partial [bacterium]|nr:hypothetical protein [bacterium]
MFWYKVPYAGWFLGFSIVLIGISWKKVSLPKHVYSFRSLNFPILFVLPFIAVILAAIHRLLGLRGGILLQLGMIVASIFISVLLTTDLFLQKHHQFRTLYTRLIPLSSIYLSMMVVFLFWSMERTKMGLVISAAILAIPVFLLLVEKLGIAVVYGFTFFILAIWPLLSEVPKSNWILGGWGFVLFLIAVYRKARAGWPVGIAIRGFYALSILYLLWLMFTFLFVDVPTQSAFLKVLLSIAQVIFVYAMFENFLTRKDVLACIIGFTAGAFFILLLVLKSAVEQITDF